jgi:putative hydrolase of the HAD superfamily
MLKAVTFDFWGTLYDPAFPREERIKLLQDTLARQGQPVQLPDLERAVDQAWKMLDEAWRRDRRSPGVGPWLDQVLGSLGATLPNPTRADLGRAIEEVYLTTRKPLLLAGVAEVLPILARRYRLGLISDVGLTPGRLLREILRSDRLLTRFDALCFSDEVGVTKPAPRIFRRALDLLEVTAAQAVHVGDLPETDLAGARAVGMRAILFLGRSGRTDGVPLAHAVLERYEQLPSLLRTLP